MTLYMTPKLKKEIKDFASKFNINVKFEYSKDFSGLQPGIDPDLIILSSYYYGHCKFTLDCIWSTVMHEICHILRKRMKHPLHGRVAYTSYKRRLIMEKDTDKYAKRLFKKHFPKLTYEGGYDGWDHKDAISFFKKYG